MGRRRIFCSFLGALLAVALSSCSLAAYFPKNASSTSDESTSSSLSQTHSSTESVCFSDSSSDVSSSVEVERAPLDFSSAPVTEKYGYQYLLANEEKREGLCGLYGALVEAFSAFAALNEDAKKTDGDYRFGAFDYTQYGLIRDEATAVWKLVFLEYPEFFWISNRVKYDDQNLYPLVAEDYALASTRLETQALIEAFALDCAAYVEQAQTQTEQAITIYDYLINRIEYAYEEDGVTPQDDRFAHSIAGAPLGAGVCETYAKTFDYLCELFGIECITVSGDAVQGENSGGHAWNIVKLENEWHAVDVTWGDRGDNTIHREWFGVPEAEFSQSHLPSLPTKAWGVEYLYGLPALSKTRVSPVKITENGALIGVGICLDEALGKVTDEQGRYEFTLDFETAATEDATLVFPPTELEETLLPKARSIRITGKSAAQTKLCAQTLSLQSELAFTDLTLSVTEIVGGGFRISKTRVLEE
ncbi:MAG: hypothetical protein J6B56_03170 [Clostridia bacterium]|nr:hypothetical protein [Clostridia bacterium]